MGINEIIVVVIGLILFEVISSVDNAVVNADVLVTMSQKRRKWFLSYGIIFAVLVVRGLLPLLIVYFSVPALSLGQAFAATFSSNREIKEIIEKSAPVLLAGGGIFLIFLFLHWLFMETKKYAFFLEGHIHKRYNFWFYALASAILLFIVWLTMKVNPLISFGAVVGSTAFFIVSGFRKNAEEKEKQLVGGHMADISKILYLELIDASFSIDGVLGAFAFTLSVPLILIGNGIGAFVVRYFTIHGVNAVRKYAYLKNGAMYSIGLLGIIMILESIGTRVYSWIPPLITFVLVAFFLYLSHKELKIEERISQKEKIS